MRLSDKEITICFCFHFSVSNKKLARLFLPMMQKHMVDILVKSLHEICLEWFLRNLNVKISESSSFRSLDFKICCRLFLMRSTNDFFQ